jgi:hypothetical protein
MMQNFHGTKVICISKGCPKWYNIIYGFSFTKVLHVVVFYQTGEDFSSVKRCQLRRQGDGYRSPLQDKQHRQHRVQRASLDLHYRQKLLLSHERLHWKFRKVFFETSLYFIQKVF